MQTLLATIVGPHKTIDLELPGDIPIKDLLPFVLDICGSHQEMALEQETASWCLRLAEEAIALQGTHTLIEAGMVDGAILYLQDLVSLKGIQQPKKKFMPRAITPGPGTGGIGVSWDKTDLQT